MLILLEFLVVSRSSRGFFPLLVLVELLFFLLPLLKFLEFLEVTGLTL